MQFSGINKKFLDDIFRKKLRADILQQYKEISAEDVKELVPTKDEMSVMKLETHSLETVVVYTIQKNPMFFQIEKVIYPTGNS